MIQFNTEEQKLICLYDPGCRDGLIRQLHEMMECLQPDEDSLEALADSVLKKIRRMTDDEYFELVSELPPFYPLEDDSFLDGAADPDNDLGLDEEPE